MRPNWHQYFFAIAEVVATRADCSRAQVGAVIVKNNRIVSTGYNGAPAGRPGCLTEGACPRAHSTVPSLSNYDSGPGACIAIHAEANAVLYAGRNNTVDSTVYVTYEPCTGCHKLMMAAGVSAVHYPGGFLAY